MRAQMGTRWEPGWEPGSELVPATVQLSGVTLPQDDPVRGASWPQIRAMPWYEPECRDINAGVVIYTAEFSRLMRRRFRQHALSKKTLPDEETLAQVRRLRKRTQVEVAITLSTRQSEISRFERRPDARVSSLAAYVAAIGGKLDLVARFPGQYIRIRLGHP